MAKKEAEKEVEAPERVTVKYNGPTGWDIMLDGRGKLSLRPGEQFAFNPRERTELRALLGIIKEVNRPATNARVRLKPQTQYGFKEQELVPRFTVDARELAKLPEVLQKHSYAASNMLTDEERAAVLELCPDFFDARIKRGGVIQVA